MSKGSLDLLQSPSRGFVRKKWRVLRSAGTDILYAEYLIKKLRHHKIPCDYEPDKFGGFWVVPPRGRDEHRGDFEQILRCAISVLNAEKRVNGSFDHGTTAAYLVVLHGDHYIDTRGELRMNRTKLSDLARVD